MTMNDTPQPTTTDREQREQRERAYKLDGATFAWTLAFRRWMADDTKPFPTLKTFLRGLTPDDADALRDYAVRTLVEGLPDVTIDEPAELALSPAGERAMAAIRAQHEGGA